MDNVVSINSKTENSDDTDVTALLQQAMNAAQDVLDQINQK